MALITNGLDPAMVKCIIDNGSSLTPSSAGLGFKDDNGDDNNNECDGNDK